MGKSLSTWRSHLRPVDLITGFFLLGCGTFALIRHAQLKEAPWLIPAYLMGCITVLVLPPFLRRIHRPWAAFLGAWYPVLCFTPFYQSTALLNQASPVPSLDPWLAHADRALFGRPFCALFSETCSHPLFAEAMAFFYFSYYLMIPGMGLFLWFRKKERFSHFVFTSAFCFYFFYWLFSLIPSAGPQYYLYQGWIEWKGVFFGPLLTHLLQAVEFPTGAFPSSHVGVALIVCGFAWRQGRGPGLIMLILLTGLAISILYGGPHYFLDLPCGLAVGFVFLGCAETCARRIEAWLDGSVDPDPTPP